MLRRAFFGGSFAPPHKAHHEILLALLKDAWVDRVHLVPTGRNPLKSEGPGRSQLESRLADPEVRRRLVEAWIAQLPMGSRDRLELETHEWAAAAEGHASYTVDTLRGLKARYPQDAFVLCVGGDIPAELERWKEPEAILRLIEGLWVFPRPGLGHGIAGLSTSWRARARLRLMGTEMRDLSSTRLREVLARGAQAGDDEFAPGVAQALRAL